MGFFVLLFRGVLFYSDVMKKWALPFPGADKAVVSVVESGERWRGRYERERERERGGKKRWRVGRREREEGGWCKMCLDLTCVVESSGLSKSEVSV